MSSGEPTSSTPPVTDPSAASPHSNPAAANAPAPSPDTSTGAAGAGSSGGAERSEWPAQATDVIVAAIERVRDTTTGPLLTVVRGVVYGLAITILGLTALVLATVMLVRFVDVYLPGEVWSAHLLLGAIFTIAGLILWSKRRSPA